MIHASVELVEAMRGVVGVVHDDSDTFHWKAQCGAHVDPGARECIWGWDANCWDGRRGYGSASTLTREQLMACCDMARVDCPACLLLVRAATCPARWDHLETLGLAPKLEAK